MLCILLFMDIIQNSFFFFSSSLPLQRLPILKSWLQFKACYKIMLVTPGCTFISAVKFLCHLLPASQSSTTASCPDLYSLLSHHPLIWEALQYVTRCSFSPEASDWNDCRLRAGAAGGQMLWLPGVTRLPLSTRQFFLGQNMEPEWLLPIFFFPKEVINSDYVLVLVMDSPSLKWCPPNLQ